MELEPEECMSITEAFIVGPPTHNMNLRGEIELLGLETLKLVPVLPRGLMKRLLNPIQARL